MKPKLFEAGGLAIHSYGFHFLLSCFLAIALLAVLLRRRGQNRSAAVDLTLLMILGYVVLGKVFYATLAKDWEFIAEPRRYPYGFWGAQLGFAALAGFYLLWSRMPFPPLADALAVTMAFVLALQKIGCFMAGCCWGTETSVPWAVTFPAG